MVLKTNYGYIIETENYAQLLKGEHALATSANVKEIPENLFEQ